MKKIGSEFLKEFGNEEKEVLFGLTKRMLVFASLLVVTVVFAIVSTLLELPDFYIYIVAVVFVVPGAAYGLGMTKEFQLQDKIRFFLINQERTFETEFKFEGVYRKDEFIPVKEKKARKGRKTAPRAPEEADEADGTEHD